MCIVSAPDTDYSFSRHTFRIFSFLNLFFFSPFLCVKDMYWLCGIPVASCEWCMKWKIFAWYTVGIQKALCSHCCAVLFFYIYRHMVVISYSFWQALYVQTPWDGMACVLLACTGIRFREIFVHNCSLCCVQKKLVPSAFANMPAWGSSSIHISGSKYAWEALLRCLYFANVCSDRDLNPRH